MAGNALSADADTYDWDLLDPNNPLVQSGAAVGRDPATRPDELGRYLRARNALAADPESIYGALLPFAANADGSTSHNPRAGLLAKAGMRFAMPGFIRDALTDALDVAATPYTGYMPDPIAVANTALNLALLGGPRPKGSLGSGGWEVNKKVPWPDLPVSAKMPFVDAAVQAAKAAGHSTDEAVALAHKVLTANHSSPWTLAGAFIHNVQNGLGPDAALASAKKSFPNDLEHYVNQWNKGLPQADKPPPVATPKPTFTPVDHDPFAPGAESEYSALNDMHEAFQPVEPSTGLIDEWKPESPAGAAASDPWEAVYQLAREAGWDHIDAADALDVAKANGLSPTEALAKVKAQIGGQLPALKRSVTGAHPYDLENWGSSPQPELKHLSDDEVDLLTKGPSWGPVGHTPLADRSALPAIPQNYDFNAPASRLHAVSERVNRGEHIPGDEFDQIEQEARQFLSALDPVLSANELEALKQYQEGASSINDVFRSLYPSYSSDLEIAQAQTLYNMLMASHLPTDLTVHRGFRVRPGSNFYTLPLHGETPRIDDLLGSKAFSSGSVFSHKAKEGFSGRPDPYIQRYLASIYLPKGFPALPVQMGGPNILDNELEMLLPPGQRYRVAHVEPYQAPEQTGKAAAPWYKPITHLHLEPVPEGTTAPAELRQGRGLYHVWDEKPWPFDKDPGAKPQRRHDVFGYIAGLGGMALLPQLVPVDFDPFAEGAGEDQAQHQAGGGYVKPLLDKAQSIVGQDVPPGALDAYHFSPHLFDRFDIGKLGTGEGYHDFGHGLNFSQNPDVTEWYFKTLGGGRGGHRYKVRINTPENKLLDWDRYLREHDLPKDFRFPDLARDAGMDPKAISDALKEIKLHGLQYFDARSRRAGAGTRNYTIFDDRLIQNLGNYLQGDHMNPKLSPSAAAAALRMIAPAVGGGGGLIDQEINNMTKNTVGRTPLG